MQLLILDALNLIRRLYAVHEQRHTDSQAALAATSASLIHAARRLLHQFKPSHVVAVFDGAPQGFRHHLYPEYKANRSPMPEPLANYLTQLQQDLWGLGIDALLSDTDEADDLIATLAYTLSQHNKPSVIVSTDQGFCQLLNTNIQLWDHFKQQALTQPLAEQRFQLSVSQLVDYWALTGVSGSNIKGVPGIGAKRALALLHQAGSLDALLSAHPASLSKAHQAVLVHREQALLARQLVKLATDVELGFNLQDLRYHTSTNRS
ncbi:flap endonuclease Xni [Oceanisphaera avium]|uniref:Flap endonuclease Xni n=1 Tax=Oceanisphaera avium TaxID=1903694 RepID=A0A1Y0CXS5_9GAMM|nr:flap endonuclease Xni [Oceanisphaera avium]ART79645.1 flap endonuclease Xni [Oceanisphaera avium]